MKNFVKILTLVALLTSLFLVTSCGKDDGPEPPDEEVVENPKEEPEEESQNPPEEEKQTEEEQSEEEGLSTEESNKIADNVAIKGSTKVEGEPPAPNGAITLDLSAALTSAVVDEGFNIPYISDADVTGAYLQFKAIDGGLSESYYDVDIGNNEQENDQSGKRHRSKKPKSKAPKGLTAKTPDGELDIDFGPEIAPGKFCYVICVYDAAGNISEPQEVCVTVNAWGGNEALVGTWNLLRYEDTFNDVAETEMIGEEYCSETSCETEEFNRISFNADSTYESTIRYENREIDGIYGDDFDEYLSRGKWSFPTTAGGDFISVEYYYSETDENGTEEETYPVGQGYVAEIKSEEIEVTATELILTYRYDDDGDGNFEEVYKEFYEKE